MPNPKNDTAKLIQDAESAMTAALAEFHEAGTAYNANHGQTREDDPAWLKIERGREVAKVKYAASLAFHSAAKDRHASEELLRANLSALEDQAKSLRNALRAETAKAADAANLRGQNEELRAEVETLTAQLGELRRHVDALGGTQLAQRLAREKRAAELKQIQAEAAAELAAIETAQAAATDGNAQ